MRESVRAERKCMRRVKTGRNEGMRQGEGDEMQSGSVRTAVRAEEG